MKTLVLTALTALTIQINAQTPLPDIPLTSNVLQFLDHEGVIELTADGFYVENGSQPKALAKTSGCCWSSLKFLKRNIVDPVTDATDYVLEGANAVVTSTTDGIKWTVDKTTDGIVYVVEKTAEGTKWTLNSVVDGTQLIVTETSKGVSWAVTAPIPDDISIGGKKYLRLDPVKKTLRAGIRIPIKVTNLATNAGQSGLNNLLDASKAYAVGTIELVDGTVFLAMDIVTFATSNGVDISQALLDLDAQAAFNKALSTVVTAITNVLNWGDLGICGSMVGWKNATYTNIFIADYWPPDELITSVAVSPHTQGCRLVGLSRTYKGCQIHDHCYSVPGKPKNVCDEEIIANWKNACRDAYDGKSGYCLRSCTMNMNWFYEKMKAESQLAYNTAQTESANNAQVAADMTNKYNYYKNKYMQAGSNEYTGNLKPAPVDYVAKPFVLPIIELNFKSLSAILSLLN